MCHLNLSPKLDGPKNNFLQKTVWRNMQAKEHADKQVTYKRDPAHVMLKKNPHLSQHLKY